MVNFLFGVGDETSKPETPNPGTILYNATPALSSITYQKKAHEVLLTNYPFANEFECERMKYLLTQDVLTFPYQCSWQTNTSKPGFFIDIPPGTTPIAIAQIYRYFQPAEDGHIILGGYIKTPKEGDLEANVMIANQIADQVGLIPFNHNIQYRLQRTRDKIAGREATLLISGFENVTDPNLGEAIVRQLSNLDPNNIYFIREIDTQ